MVNINKQQEYFTTKELAELLGISQVAIFKRIKTGKISAQMIGGVYLIANKELAKILGGELSEKDKEKVEAAVKKTIADYGAVLKMLGKE